MNQLERLRRRPCPFQLGQSVRVRSTCTYAADWPDVYIVTGLHWEYHKAGFIDVEIAPEEDIKLGLGATTGFSVYDLEPV